MGLPTLITRGTIYIYTQLVQKELRPQSDLKTTEGDIFLFFPYQRFFLGLALKRLEIKMPDLKALSSFMI